MRPVRVTMPGASLSSPAAHGRRRDGRDGGDHDLGRERRPVRAAELPLLPHRRQRARLGLQHELEQLHDAPRARTRRRSAARGGRSRARSTLNEQLITSVIQSGGRLLRRRLRGTAPPSDAGAGLPPGRQSAQRRWRRRTAGEDGGSRRDGRPGARRRHRRALRGHDRTERPRDPHAERHLARGDDGRLRPASVAGPVGALEHPQRDPERRTCSAPSTSNCAVVGYGTPAQAQASVNGTGGCVASAQSSREPVTSFALAGGLVGLVVIRVVRARRRSSKKA